MNGSIWGDHQDVTPPTTRLNEGVVTLTETKAKVTRSKQRLALLRRLHKKLYRRQRPWTYADYVFLGYLFFGMRLEEVTISRMLNRTPDQVHRALQRMAHMNLGKEKQCSDKEERKNAKKQVP